MTVARRTRAVLVTRADRSANRRRGRGRLAACSRSGSCGPAVAGWRSRRGRVAVPPASPDRIAPPFRISSSSCCPFMPLMQDTDVARRVFWSSIGEHGPAAHAMMSGMWRCTAVVVSLIAAAVWMGCSKKDADADGSGGGAADAARGREALVNRGLGTPRGQSELLDNARGAIVAQQCNLACGAKPGIDSTGCTHACIQSCGAEPDVARIDACARSAADLAAHAATP